MFIDRVIPIHRSTEDEFNPKQAQPKYLSHSLVDLLNQVGKDGKKQVF